MFSWLCFPVRVVLACAACLVLTPLAHASASPGAGYAMHLDAANLPDSCQYDAVKTVDQLKACEKQQKYERVGRAIGMSKLYLMALLALLVATVFNFRDLGLMPVVKTWLIYGLGGFLAAWFIMQIMGAAITGLGALVMFMNAQSSSLE